MTTPPISSKLDTGRTGSRRGRFRLRTPRVGSLGASLVLAVLPLTARAADLAAAPPPSPPGDRSADLTLWYRHPAANWNEALPVGNGRLGAMVFGGVADEHLQLNEGTLWSGGPGDYDRAGAYHFLPQIRRLLFEGRNAEAEALVAQQVLGERPLGAYQPLGDLRLAVAGATNVTGYTRDLDLDNAIVRIRYRAGGAVYTREIFSSAPHQVLVARLSCDRPGRISFSATLLRAEDAETAAVGTDSLVMRGQADRGKKTAGVKFVAILRVLPEGGTIFTRDGAVRVEHANAVTLLLAAATDYRGTDPEAGCLARLTTATRAGFAALRQAHIADYRTLFRRVRFHLEPGAPSDLPTDERLERFRAGAADESLFALFFQYGRYLLISSSRPGGLPANLQGIWNDRLDPPWFCGWHFDINAEMNYRAAETTNLAECHEPMLDMIERLRAPGRKTAREVYGCPGFVVSHRTNAWWFTSPVKGLTVWPVGAAWLCDDLWEHYRFTGDRAFLAGQAYPTMKEAAEFFLSWLVPDPRTGLLVSGPSVSPENSFLTPPDRSPFDLVMGPAMDQELVAALFDHCLDAAHELGIEDAFVRAVRHARSRLAGPQVGPDGRLLEWDQPRTEREPGHRHFSPLYALYPGDEITPLGTPALAEAARKSLLVRLAGGARTPAVSISDSSNVGWSIAWSAGLWARLGDGRQAHARLTTLLRRAAFPNLLDKTPLEGTPGVFQIDGNFGSTAAVAEMLVQSQSGELDLLPALPPAWDEGSISGLRARGGFEVALTWSHGRLASGEILARRGDRCRLRAREAVVVTAGNGPIAASKADRDSFLTDFRTVAGQTYVVTAQPAIP